MNGQPTRSELAPALPGLDGEFLEVEILVPAEDVEQGIDAVRAVLADLGIGDADFTTEQYTDAEVSDASSGSAVRLTVLTPPRPGPLLDMVRRADMAG